MRQISHLLESTSFPSYALIFYTDVIQVAQEVITLVRTVRVYGTEKQEFKRQFLCFLFFLSLRSIAVNTLYVSSAIIPLSLR